MYRRRRFRRNEEFVLTSPVARSIKGQPNILGLSVLGLVINPRDKEPLIAVSDGEIVGIRSLQEHNLLFRHGSGYYDTTGHGKSKEAENLTGYPRSHTPKGVSPQGLGYGTSLYTALSLGAWLVDSDKAAIKMDVHGEGISSESEGRSHEADRWWDAAAERGLTLRNTESSEAVEEYVELDVDADDITGCVSLDEGQRITHVNTVSVDLETTEEFTVDLFPYYYRGAAGVGAYNNDLVAAEFNPLDGADTEVVPDDIAVGSELRWLVESLMEDTDLFGDTNSAALLALDVRGLDVQAVNILSLCYLHSGLKDQDVNALWQRWELDLDPEAEVSQLGLFSPNARAAALADVVEARRLVPWETLGDLP